MGVKKFFEIVIKNVLSNFEGKKLSDLGEEVDLSDLSGERICIDASGMIYQAILAMYNPKALTDSSGKITAHINILFGKIMKMKESGIEQVWVFDSPKPNKLKEKELKERAAKREKAKDDKQAFKMTGEHVKDIQDLLTHLGILYIVAPPGVEAEQYGAILTQGDKPFCKYMMSGDSDVLMFGGNLLRVSYKRTGKKKTVYTTYDLKTILYELGVKREDLVKMGIAMGSDFAPKTARIGPSSVHNKLKDGKLVMTTEQQAAYDYFMSDIEMKSADLVKNKFNRQAVISMLVKRGFNEERITKRLDEVYE
jgi:flap endonuclease-1